MTQITGVVHWLRQKRSVPTDVAEEAVREALLQLLEAADRFWPDNLGGWLRRVAERRLIDANRRRPTLRLDDQADRPNDELDIDSLLAFRAALPMIDPLTRAVMLQKLSGQPWRAIAAAHGISEEAARKRCSRALNEVADRMRVD